MSRKRPKKRSGWPRRAAKGWAGDREHRYVFFLNPYEDHAFTRCPKCDRKTKLRKFCLVIHIEPRHLLNFHKTCRLCTDCELLIVKQAELEAYLAAIFSERWPESIGNDYMVLGTLPRELHRQARAGRLTMKKAVDSFTPFVDHIQFEVRGGWYLPEH